VILLQETHLMQDSFTTNLLNRMANKHGYRTLHSFSNNMQSKGVCALIKNYLSAYVSMKSKDEVGRWQVIIIRVNDQFKVQILHCYAIPGNRSKKTQELWNELDDQIKKFDARFPILWIGDFNTLLPNCFTTGKTRQPDSTLLAIVEKHNLEELLNTKDQRKPTYFNGSNMSRIDMSLGNRQSLNLLLEAKILDNRFELNTDHNALFIKLAIPPTNWLTKPIRIPDMVQESHRKNQDKH
jgi:exonuclease III